MGCLAGDQKQKNVKKREKNNAIFIKNFVKKSMATAKTPGNMQVGDNL